MQAQQSRTARSFGFDAKPEGAQHGAIASQQRTQPGAARGYGAKNCPRNPDGTSPVLGGERLRPANGPNLEPASGSLRLHLPSSENCRPGQ